MSGSGVLAGKRALVVGGGSGIGRAVVAAYRDEGAAVAVLERDAAKVESLRRELPPSGLVVHGDAVSPADCAAAVATCLDNFGGLDVVVCCAGIFDFCRRLGDMTTEDLSRGFDEIMSVNVLGQLVPIKEALPALRDSRGSIILTGSSSSFFPGRGGVLYLASKYAIRGCVAALGHELAPDVRVNGVAPGGTLGTDISGPRSLGMESLRVGTGDARVDDLRALTPLRMAMTPTDHAGSYVFLASDAARGMTGSFLHPDGGMAVRG